MFLNIYQGFLEIFDSPFVTYFFAIFQVLPRAESCPPTYFLGTYLIYFTFEMCVVKRGCLCHN